MGVIKSHVNFETQLLLRNWVRFALDALRSGAIRSIPDRQSARAISNALPNKLAEDSRTFIFHIQRMAVILVVLVVVVVAAVVFTTRRRIKT
jgi:hypothetical protein